MQKFSIWAKLKIGLKFYIRGHVHSPSIIGNQFYKANSFVILLPLGGSLFLGSLGSKGMRRSLGSPNWSCGGPLKSGPGGPRMQ